MDNFYAKLLRVKFVQESPTSVNEAQNKTAEAKPIYLGHLCKEFHYKCSVCIVKDIFSQLFMHLCTEDF